MQEKQTLQCSLLNLFTVVLFFAVLYLLQAAGVIIPYNAGIIAMIGINIVLAVSLNLTTGFLGQLVLGHAGFMSVGAYTASIITASVEGNLNITLPIALLSAGVMAALVGLVIGIPALRLRGDYLAILTLGFGEIIRVIIQNLAITGGARPFSKMPLLPATSKFTYIYIIAVVTVFAILLLVRSRHGRAIIAIREDEIAAEAAGIPTTYYKTMAFVVAAFFAGIAGGLYAHHAGSIKASDFDFNKSVELVIMVVLGGMGSITGSILAATVLTILPEMLRGFSEYRMVIYSLVLILVMIFKPGGLLGQYEFSLYRTVQRFGMFKPKPQRSENHDEK